MIAGGLVSKVIKAATILKVALAGRLITSASFHDVSKVVEIGRLQVAPLIGEM